MAKLIRKKKTVKKKTRKRKVVMKTVIPVSTPVGSVHFDEFLRACKESSLPLNVTKPVKKTKEKKKKNTKRNATTTKPKKTVRTEAKEKGSKKKKLKKKEVVKPKDVTQNKTGFAYPTLFPLIKDLLQPAEDYPSRENDMFSEFVVGPTDPPDLERRESMLEKNLIEQEANGIIDEINKAQEKIKTLMQKPHLTQSETVALADQNASVTSLLADFENCLARIQGVWEFDGVRAENTDGDGDDDNWLDIDDGDKTPEEQRALTCDVADNVVESPHGTNGAKWYEAIDLAYLLSPNTSFDRKRTLSSDALDIFEEFRTTATARDALKRNELFNRLKDKFSVLLPPLKTKRADENLILLEKKFDKDHRDMLNSTKHLKLVQCWNQLEFQYNMISALIISLKDAIKSTSPFYYANANVRSRFVDDQSALAQALDEVKRKTKDTFLRAGLEDYWKIIPESITLGAARPCFEITIRHHTVNDHATDERFRTAALCRRRRRRSDNADVCKEFRTRDVEIEVRTVDYTS